MKFAGVTERHGAALSEMTRAELEAWGLQIVDAAKQSLRASGRKLPRDQD